MKKQKKNDSCNSFGALINSIMESYCKVFNEFCKDLLNELIKQSPCISLDMEEKEDVK